MISQNIPSDLKGPKEKYKLHYRNVSISNCFVSSKIYDKRDDFDFDIVNVPFLMAMFHIVTLMELIRFTRVCSHVEHFNARNKCLTAKLFKP